MKKNPPTEIHADPNSTPNLQMENNSKTIRVLLVDDHTVVREGFKLLLEREPGIAVIGEARTGEEAIRLSASLSPDVILMDITMPDLNGLQAAHVILTRDPEMKIIILSMSDNDEFIQHSLQVGIQGYLLKENASQEVINAVREVVVNGNPYYGPAVQKKMLRIQRSQLSNFSKGNGDPVVNLTPRELEVLQLVAEGKTTAEIGQKLFISIKTVQKHRQAMMDKLDIHDAIGLTRYAILKGVSKV